MITHRDVGDENQPRKGHDVSWSVPGASTQPASAAAAHPRAQAPGGEAAIMPPRVPAEHQRALD